MERIAIAGLSLHGTDVGGLEGLRRPTPSDHNAFLRDLADALSASELVLLATCNRLEVVWAREEGELPSEADGETLCAFLRRTEEAAAPTLPAGWMQRTGRDAIRHLFRVASSLDSLVVGEDQILGQVRDAYARSADIGLVGPLLGPLFHNALQIAKKVRTDTGLARHPVSVVNLAVARLLERARDSRPHVAVIGAGAMGQLLVRALSEAGLPPALVVNRSLPRAAALAAGVGAHALELSRFLAGEQPVDALVTATASSALLLDRAQLLRLGERTPGRAPLLAIDLSVPRNLPALAEPTVQVVDLDALRAVAEANRALRAEAAAHGERLIEDKLASFTRRFREDAAAPVVTELRQEAEAILRRELDGLLGGRLAHLGEDDRRAIERWARATFGRLMHPSVSAVKRMAWERSGRDHEPEADHDTGDDTGDDAGTDARHDSGHDAEHDGEHDVAHDGDCGDGRRGSRGGRTR